MLFVRKHINKVFFLHRFFCCYLCLYFLIPFPKVFLKKASSSIKLYDRNGILLMDLFYYKDSYYGTDSGFSEELKLSEVSKSFQDLLIFSEDRRFYSHIGIDFKALIRSIYQNVTRGYFVSGGSTE